MAETWERLCPHCRKEIIVNVDAKVIHRRGVKSLGGGSGKHTTVKLKNPIEAADALWAWRDSLGMTSCAEAAMRVGFKEAVWRSIENGSRSRVTLPIYKKIKEETGICL